MKSPYFPCLLIIMIAIFASSCTNIQAPLTVFQRYEIDNVGLTRANVSFLFDVENPNTIPIGIKDIVYSVALDGSKLMSGTSEGFSIQAKEKKTIKIPVEVVYSSLIGQAANLARKFIMKDDSISYRLDGEVSVVDNVGFSARVPINAEGEIKFF